MYKQFMEQRTVFLGSFPASVVRYLAGYRSAGDPAFALDCRRYDLNIRSHAPDSWRESRYRVGPLVRAASMGRLRELGFGPSKVGRYLDAVNDGAVEEAISKFWAGVVERVWLCLPPALERGESRVFAHTAAERDKLIESGAEIVFDLTETLEQLKGFGRG